MRVRVLACLEDPLVIGKIPGPRETQQAVLVETGRAALPTTGARGFLVAVVSGHHPLRACYPQVL